MIAQPIIDHTKVKKMPTVNQIVKAANDEVVAIIDEFLNDTAIDAENILDAERATKARTLAVLKFANNITDGKQQQKIEELYAAAIEEITRGADRMLNMCEED